MPSPISLVATEDGLASGDPINDAFASKTEIAGTPITRAVPAHSKGRTKVASFSYTTLGTSHTVTMMTVVAEVTVTSDAASGQAVLPISSVPVSLDGSILAANDWFVLRHEDGSYAPYMVSSISGLSVTLSSNLAQKVEKGAKAFFMGAPADHSATRQYTVDANTTLTITGTDYRVCACTATKRAQPILVHSNNATAAGILRWVAYVYD